MRKLHLLFKNANGSRKQLIIEHCHQHLSPEVVYQAMVQICALEIFERDGVQLYTEIVGAKYVEKRVTQLFDDFNPTFLLGQNPHESKLKPENLLPMISPAEITSSAMLNQKHDKTSSVERVDSQAVANFSVKAGFFDLLTIDYSIFIPFLFSKKNFVNCLLHYLKRLSFLPKAQFFSCAVRLE